MIMGFQSTHPARGATFSLIHHCLCRIYFNPRTPRGVRLVLRSVICSFSDFNPRTPRGVRPVRQFSTQRKAVFQSTHPARGATLDDFARTCVLMEFQSTHPARGATHFAFCRRQWALNFNPRTPRGVRLLIGIFPVIWRIFQSTHPARGATANFTKEQGVCLAQFAYLHKGKKAEHTKTNAPMLH